MKYNLVLNASKNEFQSLAITGGHFETDYPRFCVKFQQVQNEAFEIWVRCWFLAPGLFNYTQ